MPRKHGRVRVKHKKVLPLENGILEVAHGAKCTLVMISCCASHGLFRINDVVLYNVPLLVLIHISNQVSDLKLPLLLLLLLLLLFPHLDLFQFLRSLLSLFFVSLRFPATLAPPKCVSIFLLQKVPDIVHRLFNLWQKSLCHFENVVFSFLVALVIYSNDFVFVLAASIIHHILLLLLLKLITPTVHWFLFHNPHVFLAPAPASAVFVLRCRIRRRVTRQRSSLADQR
mmetsp:Transcript_11922/g.22342  ORF Transcript_11922/g.22342 Transcript_11922/m.22342 type:complete len:228 (-) Transcript_11922:109-792(-)